MLSDLVLLAYLTAFRPQPEASPNVVLASHSISLENRHKDTFVNGVFKDNILLAIHYLKGSVSEKSDIDWENIRIPFKYSFSLNPGEAFAFHDQVLVEYKSKVVKTTNAHFNYTDGFISDGRLVGDGVCHLASLMHWVARDSGLTSISLASHDFRAIPEISKEFGVSIKYMPGEFANSARQNLYIINNLDTPVNFIFDYDGTNLTISTSVAKE